VLERAEIEVEVWKRLEREAMERLRREKPGRLA
jgi:hypothetical protein